MWQNLRDMISPPKLPPLNVTSKPVAVKEIWSKNTQFTRVQSLSIAFHILVLVLIIVPLLPQLMSPGTTKANAKYDITTISPYLPEARSRGEESGRRRRAAQPYPGRARSGSQIQLDAIFQAAGEAAQSIPSWQ